MAASLSVTGSSSSQREVPLPERSAGSLTLTQLKESLPAGLDATRKEQYLSDEEFVKAFSMPRDEFYALKPWKQAQLKKVLGIF